jgi:hypothetical protein
MTRLVRLDPRTWILAGARMSIRGARTTIDPPLNPIQPEVRPA